MEEIETLLINPYTYLSIGSAALIGVFWGKMNPSAANLILVFGVLLITLFAFMHPLVSANPMFIRVLWTLASGSILGLLAYYILWTAFVPLLLSSTTTAAEKPPDVIIGEIQWSPKYTDVRVRIDNNSQIDFKNIDLILQPDQSITKASQITNIDGVSLNFNSLPSITPEYLYGKDKRKSIPTIPLASTLGFRLRCDALPRKSHIEIVLAAVSLNDINHNRDEDTIFTINYNDGASVSFVHKDHSDVVFRDKPVVRSIIVTGQYIAAGRQHKISKTLTAIDSIADAMPKIIPH